MKLLARRPISGSLSTVFASLREWRDADGNIYAPRGQRSLRRLRAPRAIIPHMLKTHTQHIQCAMMIQKHKYTPRRSCVALLSHVVHAHRECWFVRAKTRDRIDACALSFWAAVDEFGFDFLAETTGKKCGKSRLGYRYNINVSTNRRVIELE